MINLFVRTNKPIVCVSPLSHNRHGWFVTTDTQTQTHTHTHIPVTGHRGGPCGGARPSPLKAVDVTLSADSSVPWLSNTVP